MSRLPTTYLYSHLISNNAIFRPISTAQAIMPLTGTILEILTAQNPTLDLRQQPAGPVSQSGIYLYLEDPDILDWPDFMYANLEAAFGHLFGIGPITLDAIQNLRGTPTEITKESHVNDLSMLWNYQTCRWPLKRGAESIQSSLGIRQVDVTIKHDGRSSKDPKSDSKAKAPDWSIYLKEDGTVIVWGDSKCSGKWSSERDNIPRGLWKNWIWPFRQVLTYCVNNATRYGYVLTPREVVVRVVEANQTTGRPWRVQRASIPWDNAGPGILSQLVHLGFGHDECQRGPSPYTQYRRHSTAQLVVGG